MQVHSACRRRHPAGCASFPLRCTGARPTRRAGESAAAAAAAAGLARVQKAVAAARFVSASSPATPLPCRPPEHALATAATTTGPIAMTVHSKLVEQGDVWIFGFGSLVHNPGFKYTKRVEGFIHGWRRVFWQGSTDHRGVPERPGRTVTLEEREGAVTSGVAFQLAGDKEEQQRTLEYLEWREKQYDLRVSVDVFGRHDPDTPAVRGALVYVATSDRLRNPNYLGPASDEEIAHQIATSCGPSGPNHEYLFRLADAMRQMMVDDEELFRLEVLVRDRMAALGQGVEEV